MPVPFIDLKRYEPGFLTRWQERVSAMSRRSEFVGGAEVSKLEETLTQRLGVGHAVTCANGTDALQLALRALGVGRGDRVLVPEMTFWATFEAVVNVGADPITFDIDPEDGGVDLEAFQQAIDQYQPKAAIIAHLYGWGTRDLAVVRALCEERGVFLLEDGAQCFGVEFNGASVYRDALVSTSSFYPAKVLGAAGDGGAVFTNDATIAEKVRQLGNHGRNQHYGHGRVGWNSRMDALQAGFLNLSLEFIDQRLVSRRQSASHYREYLKCLPMRIMAVPQGYVENGYCNVCLLEPSLRLTLQAALKKADIGFGNIYPGAMSAQPGAKEYLLGSVIKGQAAKYCESILNLPLFPYMTAEELAEVVAVVKKTLS